VDSQIEDFLKLLCISEPIQPGDMAPMTVSEEDYQTHWKQSREKISSSMSGLHFGHWKAVVKILFAEIARSFPAPALPPPESKSCLGHSLQQCQEELFCIRKSSH